MKLDVYDLNGKVTEQINLPKDIFEAKINEILIAQAVRVYQGNQRMASAKTKTRAEVARTTKKVYRQKGTGQARHGSRRAPIYVGGGVAHGPRGNQNYKLDLPKKMKVAALKSALSMLAKEKKITLVSGLADVTKPKTKDMAVFLNKIIDAKQQRQMGFVVDAKMEQTIRSVRNIDNVSIYKASDLTTFDVVRSNCLIMAVETVKTLENRLTK